jgi:hypothetical protein
VLKGVCGGTPAVRDLALSDHCYSALQAPPLGASQSPREKRALRSPFPLEVECLVLRWKHGES